MKKLLFLSLLLCFGCSRCWESPSTTANAICEESPARYVPNEIILDVQELGTNYDAYKNHLRSKGFVTVDSCNCSHRLELMRNPQDVDVIGHITDAGAAGGLSGGSGFLSPNFINRNNGNKPKNKVNYANND